MRQRTYSVALYGQRVRGRVLSGQVLTLNGVPVGAMAEDGSVTSPVHLVKEGKGQLLAESIQSPSQLDAFEARMGPSQLTNALWKSLVQMEFPQQSFTPELGWRHLYHELIGVKRGRSKASYGSLNKRVQAGQTSKEFFQQVINQATEHYFRTKPSEGKEALLNLLTMFGKYHINIPGNERKSYQKNVKRHLRQLYGIDRSLSLHLRGISYMFANVLEVETTETASDGTKTANSVFEGLIIAVEAQRVAGVDAGDGGVHVVILFFDASGRYARSKRVEFVQNFARNVQPEGPNGARWLLTDNLNGFGAAGFPRYDALPKDPSRKDLSIQLTDKVGFLRYDPDLAEKLSTQKRQRRAEKQGGVEEGQKEIVLQDQDADGEGDLIIPKIPDENDKESWLEDNSEYDCEDGWCIPDDDDWRNAETGNPNYRLEVLVPVLNTKGKGSLDVKSHRAQEKRIVQLAKSIAPTTSYSKSIFQKLLIPDPKKDEENEKEEEEEKDPIPQLWMAFAREDDSLAAVAVTIETGEVPYLPNLEGPLFLIQVCAYLDGPVGEAAATFLIEKLHNTFSREVQNFVIHAPRLPEAVWGYITQRYPEPEETPGFPVWVINTGDDSYQPEEEEEEDNMEQSVEEEETPEGEGEERDTLEHSAEKEEKPVDEEENDNTGASEVQKQLEMLRNALSAVSYAVDTGNQALYQTVVALFDKLVQDMSQTVLAGAPETRRLFEGVRVTTETLTSANAPPDIRLIQVLSNLLSVFENMI